MTMAAKAAVKKSPTVTREPAAATPAPPAPLEGHCIRCGASAADTFHNGNGPFCGSGCGELFVRGL